MRLRLERRVSGGIAFAVLTLAMVALAAQGSGYTDDFTAIDDPVGAQAHYYQNGKWVLRRVIVRAGDLYLLQEGKTTRLTRYGYNIRPVLTSDGRIVAYSLTA